MSLRCPGLDPRKGGTTSGLGNICESGLDWQLSVGDFKLRGPVLGGGAQAVKGLRNAFQPSALCWPSFCGSGW